MGGIALLPVFLRIKTCLPLVSCSLLSIMTVAAVRTTTGGFPLARIIRAIVFGVYTGVPLFRQTTYSVKRKHVMFYIYTPTQSQLWFALL